MAEIHGFIVVNQVTPVQVQVVNIDQIVRYLPDGTGTQLFLTDGNTPIVSQSPRDVEAAIRAARALPEAGT